jgi:thymidylate synthase
MRIAAATLDDLLRRVFSKLLKTDGRAKPTRGKTLELTGVLLTLSNPRARLSQTELRGKLFSCLGELLWYLAQSNELRFIKYYVSRYEQESEDGRTIHGAYGPRLFGTNGYHNQIGNVVARLKENEDTRRAVIQLFDAADLAGGHKEIPCTCTLQFILRNHRLHMLTSMRSNDAFLGLPHDVFAFTMLQEILARTLGKEVGVYNHVVGSLHLYETDVKGARKYLAEGWQPTMSMPAMPLGDPWHSIDKLLAAERRIRHGHEVAVADLALDPYWADIVRLLQIFRYSRDGTRRRIAAVKRRMSTPIYNSYIEKRQVARAPTSTGPEQFDLFDTILSSVP